MAVIGANIGEDILQIVGAEIGINIGDLGFQLGLVALA
jgi:hypothetical protein